MTARKARTRATTMQQQIPEGNDSKKSKNKGNHNATADSLLTARKARTKARTEMLHLPAGRRNRWRTKML
jgi:hypothetical protein